MYDGRWADKTQDCSMRQLYQSTIIASIIYLYAWNYHRCSFFFFHYFCVSHPFALIFLPVPFLICPEGEKIAAIIYTNTRRLKFHVIGTTYSILMMHRPNCIFHIRYTIRYIYIITTYRYGHISTKSIVFVMR